MSQPKSGGKKQPTSQKKQPPVERHDHDSETHRRLYSCEIKLEKVLHLLRRMTMTQQELAEDLKTVKNQVAKIGEESGKTLEKVTELETALANAGNVTPEVQQAMAELKAQVQKVDDMIPDAPAP